MRLLRELPESALPQYTEGSIVSVLQDTGGEPLAAEVRFYREQGELTARVPFADMELVISRSMLDKTAVFWALDGPPEKVVAAAMHSVLDAASPCAKA